VLAALRDGSFYGSAGPVIEALDVTENAVEVRCSPERSITLLAGRWFGSRVNADRPGYPGHGDILATDGRGEITAARLERPAHTPYGRLEVEDSRGRRAWTNPLWMRR